MGRGNVASVEEMMGAAMGRDLSIGLGSWDGEEWLGTREVMGDIGVVLGLVMVDWEDGEGGNGQ